MIVQSSKKGFHVVFDHAADWIDNVSIMAWVVLHSKNPGLLKWFTMQCIKRSSTLRVSSKGDKPPPRIVHREGCQDDRIKSYLDFRETLRGIFDQV